MPHAKLRQRLIAASIAFIATAPSWAKDTLVHPEGRGRTLIAADALSPDRLAVSGYVGTCPSYRGVHVSPDRAKTWSTHCLPVLQDGYTMGETPALAFDAEGTLWAAGAMESDFDSRALFAAQSTDGGRTWSDWKYVTATSSTHGGMRGVRVHVDDHPGSPYRGSIYVSYTVWEEEGPQPAIAFTRNRGESWSRRYATPYSTDESMSSNSLAIGSDGELHLAYAECGEVCPKAKVLAVRSRDGGESWSPSVKVADVPLPGGSSWWGDLPGTTKGLTFEPSLAVDASKGPRRGELYLALVSATGEHLSAVTTRSEDGGKHWSAVQPLSPSAADQFMVTLSVNRRGEMAAVWLDRRNDPEGMRYQPMVAFSSDGGRVFGEPKALDGDLSDPRLGDYSLASMASHAWAGHSVRIAFLGEGRHARLTVRSNHAKP